MSTIGRSLALASLACAFATAALPTHAQNPPRPDTSYGRPDGDPTRPTTPGRNLVTPLREVSTGLRCHYRPSGDRNPAATAFVQANAYTVKGYWRSGGVLPSRKMFFTDARPGDLRAACGRTLASTPRAGELVTMSAADNARSYNHEFWFNGDQARGAPVERIVAFGDSLSDNGNVYNESQWVLPGSSWFLGRFSNGPVWIDHLARKTGLPLNNWSIGGAQSTDVYGGLIQGIESQVDSFIGYTAAARDYDPSRTLFTFLIGGNDFVNDTKTAPQVIESQEKALRKLVANGARKILVVNLPDISQAPVFRLGRNDAHTVLGKVEYYNHHIALVAERVAAASGATIRVVNARSYFDDLLTAPGQFGFANATESCLAIDSTNSINYTLPQRLRAGCDPSRYVFWDTLHPTSRVHELMANWAIDYTPTAWGLRR